MVESKSFIKEQKEPQPLLNNKILESFSEIKSKYALSNNIYNRPLEDFIFSNTSVSKLILGK